MNPISPKMIFLNIGWMNEYRGLDGDKIEGGGAFVKENGYGHEMFNFLPWNGKLYGYAPCHFLINIGRLGAWPGADQVTDILVIWVARHPSQGGSYITGWYDNATVRKELKEPTWAANRVIGEYITPRILARNNEIGTYAQYLVEADQQNCQLIPVNNRKFAIPRGGTGNMGWSPVWYAEDPNRGEFRKRVADYVRTTREIS